MPRRDMQSIRPPPIRPALPLPASVDLADLRCEYLQDPLGIDVAQAAAELAAGGQGRRRPRTAPDGLPGPGRQQPRSGWPRTKATSGTRAKWPPVQSVHVAYAGSPLASRDECFWKVRVRDQAGKLSAWSEPAAGAWACWSRAIGRPSWIGTDAVLVRRKGWPIPDNTMPDPWFRKPFTLDAAPAAGDALRGLDRLSRGLRQRPKGRRYACWRPVPRTTRSGPATAPMTLPSTCSRQERARPVAGHLLVDLPALQERRPAGQPDGAGAGRDRAARGKPSCAIATDATWRTHPSPNTLLGVWDFMHFGGERYDANRELPDWCQADLDDSAWKPATTFSPRLTLSAEMVEPNRRKKAIRPVAIEQRPGGEYRVDMGVNFAGFVEIDLRGTPGKRIDMQFSERADQAMTHRLHSAYVLGPSGKGTFPQPLQLQRGPLDHHQGARRQAGPGRRSRLAGPHRLPPRGRFRVLRQAPQRHLSAPRSGRSRT